jgi:LPS sulfotransferase NodH
MCSLHDYRELIFAKANTYTMNNDDDSPSFARRAKELISNTLSRKVRPIPYKLLRPLDIVGVHERTLLRYYPQFKFAPDCEPLNKPICIVLFTNRSGSSLIGEHMRASNRFSGFGEPLNHKLVIKRSDREGIKSFPDYLRWELENVGREGCMFGMKSSYSQAMMLVRSGAVPRFFNDVRWVILRRRDILSQAISFSIAFQTKQWSSKVAQEQSTVQYNFQDIEQRLKNLTVAYNAMDAFCEEQGVDPYRIVYEDFALDPIQGARDLAAHLGVTDVDFDHSELKMRKQRNELSEEFRQKFLEEYRGPLLGA